MRNAVFVMLILSGFVCKAQMKLQITEKFSAICIGEGYGVMPTDSTFHFSKKWYLVRTKEYYDKNECILVALWKPLGYLELKKNEFSGSAEFYTGYNINPVIDAFIVDKKKINVNGKLYQIKGYHTALHKVYYIDPADSEILYIIKYL